MATEEWRPVVGFEGAYEVSDQGRVRSLDRVVESTVRWRSGIVRTVRTPHAGRLLAPGIASHGYPTVCLSRGASMPGRSFCVHALVLNAFVGPCPDGFECRHLNGRRDDPALDNLLWGSRKQNADDSAAHGTRVRGADHKRARLTDDAVREIRRLRGLTSQSALALQFGVSPAAVQAVHDGRTWRHVDAAEML